MRNLFCGLAFMVALTFASTNLNAQTDQGNILVGASSNLSFITEDTGGDDNTNTFLINIRGGYFFIDNLAGGLNAGFNSRSQGDFSTSTLNIGPFARYYVMGKFFAGAGFDFVSSSPNEGDNVTGSLISFEAGYPIFIGGETVAIEPTLNYGIGGGDLLEDYSAFGVQVGFFIYL